jgi:hypothetical protein
LRGDERLQWANARHPREHIAALERSDTRVAEVKAIDRRLETGDRMMPRLWLAEVVSDARCRARFGQRILGNISDFLNDV